MTSLDSKNMSNKKWFGMAKRYRHYALVHKRLTGQLWARGNQSRHVGLVLSSYHSAHVDSVITALPAKRHHGHAAWTPSNFSLLLSHSPNICPARFRFYFQLRNILIRACISRGLAALPRWFIHLSVPTTFSDARRTVRLNLKLQYCMCVCSDSQPWCVIC